MSYETTQIVDPASRLIAAAYHADEMFVLTGLGPTGSMFLNHPGRTEADYDQQYGAMTDADHVPWAETYDQLAAQVAELAEHKDLTRSNPEADTLLHLFPHIDSVRQEIATDVGERASRRAGRGAHAAPGRLARALDLGLETFRRLAVRGAERSANADRLDPIAGREDVRLLRRLAITATATLERMRGGDGLSAVEQTMQLVVDTQRDMKAINDGPPPAIAPPTERPYGLYSDPELMAAHRDELALADGLDRTRAPLLGEDIEADLARARARFRDNPDLVQALASSQPDLSDPARDSALKRAAAIHADNARMIRVEVSNRILMSPRYLADEDQVRRAAAAVTATASVAEASFAPVHHQAIPGPQVGVAAAAF